MSQDYMWFDIDANKKIGKKQLRVLNQIYIEDTLINYLINPLNRTILNDVPNMIENIEQHTIRATPSDDAQDKWNEDKEGTFIHMLEEAYKNLMNDPLESLVETYIPNMENLGKNPKRGTYWEKLEDFKGEKHYTNPETEEIFIIPKHYFRLNAPELYEFRGAPFGSHDPIEAANKEMPNPVDINVFQSNLIVEEKPQSTAGYHYHSNNGSAPVDHKIPSDKWIDLGIDFTGVKLKLPVPHPTPPDPISD